jgi:hypothetical protein
MDLAEEKLKVIPQIKDVFKISCTQEDMTLPPKDYKPQFRIKRYWCPYCGEERRFLDIFGGDYLNCEVCHVSDREFNVKTVNKLDPVGKADFRARKSAKRSTKLDRRSKLKELREATQKDEIAKKNEMYGTNEED